MKALITFITGLLFGVGLAFSEMTNPAVVIGFLDITRNWNPSLLFVMVGAIAIGFIGYQIQKRRKKPLFDSSWSIPTRKDIDSPLIIGSILFGIGWGLSGYCPGPGLTALINNPSEGIIFVIALILGSGLFQVQSKLQTKPQ
ncbi:YeeE/YedE family protein [Marinomonas algicola]|uniref:YeeE/YedE family protein n=1 Tax=Marinomonas algicola TaxID=2773454 RepID=UPI0017496F45|nr:YeeE/YedE family protein [Marinomonas algicola]